jgi:hypothetical protein
LPTEVNEPLDLGLFFLGDRDRVVAPSPESLVPFEKETDLFRDLTLDVTHEGR